MSGFKTRLSTVSLAGIGVFSFGLASCAQNQQLEARVAQTQLLTRQAQDNGALQCTPRELALAHAYLDFAEIELKQGSLASAKKHLERADVNARAALEQSPKELCSPSHETSAPSDTQSFVNDFDSDGFLDAVDECVEDPEVINGFQDLDGCPDDPNADTDNDGLKDSIDLCRTQAEDTDGYQDLDGCPELDNDGDTVADLADQCPNTPGLIEVEPYGCPAGETLVIMSDCEIKTTEDVQFTAGEASIERGSLALLSAVQDVLIKNPDIKLELQGRLDPDAPKPALSEQRVRAVKNWLIDQGIDQSRIIAHGVGGQSHQRNPKRTVPQALNRRIRLMRVEGQKTECATESKEARGSNDR